MRKLLLLLTVAFLCVPVTANATSTTTVSISGDDFRINGTVTYPGKTVEGLLLNSRMINGIFNDAHTANWTDWAYPDTLTWDADRNTSEFVAKMPTYASKGLNMVTVGMQGGCPWEDGNCGNDAHRDENVSAFNSDGSVKAQWFTRLNSVLNAADTNGIAVTISLFYEYQDQRVTTDAGVETAAKNVIDHVQAGGWTNVLLEVCNECNAASNPGFDHTNLDPSTTGTGSLPALITTLDTYAGGSIPISASVTGAYANAHNITSAMFTAMDYVTVHCNAQSSTTITNEVQWIQGQTSKPVVFNECGTDTAKMDTAIGLHASWGYYDQGDGSYTTAGSGFQSMPTKWGIGSTAKTAFFDHVSALTS